jgi:7-alpha-hydroxysteroid dehydrogenase
VAQALVERAVAELGRLDVVVNNAGGAEPRAFLDTTVDELEAAFHLNVSAAFELVKLATPHLLDSGVGSVVNVSSAMDRMVGRGLLVYGTVKAALSHMTRLLAADLAPRVRANAIAAPRCQPSRTSSPICSGPRAVMAPICALILNA